MTRRTLVALAVCLLAGTVRAAGAKPAAGKTDPPGVPVEAVLKAKQKTYKLDLGDKTAAEFQKDLDAAATTRTYPAVPTVDLVLVLRNTGKDEIKIQMGGTNNIITLDLRGPGAVKIPWRGITNKLIILPRPVTLAPGKSVEVPIKSLSFGRKGAFRAYWTKPGKYTLTARYKTAVSPVPKGATDNGKGFGDVTVTSAPVALKVEAK